MKQKKRKRLLSILVTLAMVISLMPGISLTAYADGEHTYDGITFVEWTDALAKEQNGPSSTAATSLPSKAGNYYLTQDVTVTARWNTPSGTTNLCLGGKTITGKLSESANHDSSVVNIAWDSTLNLYDDEEGAGKIVSEEYVFSEEGSNFTVLVRVVDTFDGTFNMYGGTLCATEGNQVYSGVYVNGGSFTLHGGTIQGARASGVDVGSRNGVFTMNGGTITGNEARQGGGVFVQEDGTFTMNGGSITGNEAIATETKDEDGFPMYKGGQGGGVYVEAGGTFTMAGGSITGNDAQRYGGGVYNAGTFGISGAPEISGNIHTHAPGYQDADNVYLERDKVVNVAGELANTVPIGITMQAEDVFTSGEASDYKAKFASDSDEFVVAVKGKELMLQHLKHGMSEEKPSPTPDTEAQAPEAKEDSPEAEKQIPASILLNSQFLVSWKGTKVQVTWGSVHGADTYEIYAEYCGKKQCVKISTVHGGNKLTFSQLNGKKLNPKKAVKVYVEAYSGGKKLGRTLLGHAAGPKNKQTNAKKVKASKNTYKLKIGKSAKIKAGTVKESKRKKLLGANHSARYRYATSDMSVATVDKKGRIRAVGTGTCYIWVYAQNGRSKKLTVTVQQ